MGVKLFILKKQLIDHGDLPPSNVLSTVHGADALLSFNFYGSIQGCASWFISAGAVY
jgi:hypothetical protein